jgi:hypothetical protein
MVVENMAFLWLDKQDYSWSENEAAFLSKGE